MVDITSLKVRLARLRLASELDDDPRLEDPARKDLDKKRGRKKKAQLDDWEDQEVRDSEQAENESLAQEDAAEFAPKKKTKKASKDPYSEYTKNTGGKRKKNNKLTRSDQKRGKKDKEKVRGSYNRTKRQEGSTQEYSGFGEYVKNTGDRRKKKNKLTRSDKKRP